MGAGYADKELKHPLDDLQIQTPVPLAYRMFCAKCGIGEPLEVAGWSLEQQGVPVACREVSGTASPSYRKAMGGAKAFEAHLTGYRNELRGRIIGMPYHLRMRVDHPVQTDQARIQDSGRSLEDENPIRTIRAWMGKRHPYVALALEGVGMQYHWAEKDAKAEELLTRAIQISEESLGPLHPDHVSRLASLGRIYRERGQMDRAEPLLSQAKETALEVFGDKNGRYALALRDLALLYQDTGRIAEAETMLRRAVESCKDASPLDRAEVLPVLISLGELESRMGELEKAEGLLRQVETAYERFWKESRFRQPSETQEAFDKRSHVSRLIPVELAKGQTMLARKLLQDGQRAEARSCARSLSPHGSVPRRGANPARSLSGLEQRDDECPSGSHPVLSSSVWPRDDRACRAFHGPARSGSRPPLHRSDRPDVWPGQSRSWRPLSHHEQTVLAQTQCPHLHLYRPHAGTQTVGNGLRHQKKKGKTGRTDARARCVLATVVREKFEQSVGREHPDTLGMMQAQARREWRSNGPQKAEATLRDAFRRALDLSNRVVAGLPEAQAYQFLEANRPPTDLLLSCYRAASKDHVRDAYEVHWSSKALATRLLMERRHLLQAVSGQPELRRLADELQSTRRQLAQLSLSAPVGAGAERRGEQLAELTGRKEDLERQLAMRSEPFRRTLRRRASEDRRSGTPSTGEDRCGGFRGTPAVDASRAERPTAGVCQALGTNPLL